METLLTELDSANLPSPVPWDIAHRLPYLDACIKEALRMTPAVGIPLERVAPAGGMELCGKYFQGGTVLGVNAWVAHRNQEVFGEDADVWRPGRWVEASADQRKAMERAQFAVSFFFFFCHPSFYMTSVLCGRYLHENILMFVFSISLVGGRESALGKTSRIWRCIRLFLNC